LFRRTRIQFLGGTILGQALLTSRPNFGLLGPLPLRTRGLTQKNHELIYLGKIREKPTAHRKGDEFVFSRFFLKSQLIVLSEGNCSIAKSKCLSLEKQLETVEKGSYCNQCG